ncbi:MAG: ABC transporter permease, partial [Anaerolineae bacterium]
MQNFLADLRAVRTTAVLFLKQQAVDGFIIFTVLVQPLLIALLAIFLYRDRAGDIAIYLIVGSGMTGLWSGLLFTSAGNIGAERWSGTLEVLVATPTPMSTIILGKVLANVALSFSSMVFGYAMAAVVFRFPLEIVDPIAFALSLLFAVFAFVAVGMLVTPFFAVSPAVQGWVNALEYPVYIAGGFLFPILLLPIWSNPLSYVL